MPKNNYFVLLFLESRTSLRFMLPSVRQIAPRVLLAVLVLNLTGGNWVLLQSVAWSRMLIDYSQLNALPVAIMQTFDGKHPCKMCVEIERESQSEKKSEIQQGSSKIELFNKTEVFVFLVPSHFWIQDLPDFLVFERSESPPLRPPRSLWV
jgi:hypothetical protein